MNIFKAIPLIVIFLTLSIISFFKNNNKIFAIFLFIISLSLGISFVNPFFNQNSGEYTCLVIEAKSNYVIVLSNCERLYLSCKENTYEIGDILLINGRLSEINFVTLESEFDFTNYLNLKGVIREITSTNVDYKFQTFIKIKAFKNNFLSKYNDNTKALIDAFLFNVKDYNNSIIGNFHNISLLHILSISGIYLNLIFKGLLRFLNLKINEKYSFILALGIMGFYLIFAFNKISVRRVTYLFIARNINKHFLKNKFNSLQVSSFIGTLMLLVNRHNVYEAGFYIGFLITITFYFSKYILERGNRFIRKIKSFGITYFLLLPYLLNSSNSIHLLNPIYQTLLLPLNFLFLILALLSFYTTVAFGFILNPLTNFYEIVSNFLNKIDVSIYCKNLNVYFIILYYLSFYFILFINDFKIPRLGRKVTLIISLPLLISFIPYENLYETTVSFLNVGQGDSCLIRLRDKTILIDTGGLTYKDVATSCTISYLKKRKIYSIDYVIGTHEDNDHIGALESLKENFKIKNIILNSSSFPLTIGDYVFENLNTFASSNENDSSLVIKSTINGKTFLWTGDASSDVEKMIINKYPNLKTDYLKVGHHGSKSSTCEEFIKTIKPKEGIISVGKNNYYGHPNEEVLSILKSNNVKIRRTDLEGTITYSL